MLVVMSVMSGSLRQSYGGVIVRGPLRARQECKGRVKSGHVMALVPSSPFVE